MNTFIWEWEHEMNVNDDKYGMVIHNHNLLVESAGTKNDENINLMTKMEILKCGKMNKLEKSNEMSPSSSSGSWLHPSS